MAPNFFLAVKGPDGSTAVANRQACSDGALGARGIQNLQSYGQKKLPYDNKAYKFSSTYIAGFLSMDIIHPTQQTSPRSRPEYVMHQLRAFAMLDSAEAFRQGGTCYRNARDLAKKYRDEAIRGANKRVVEYQARTLTTNGSFGQASSFVSKVASDGTCTSTIEALSPVSRTSPEDSNATTTHPQEYETLLGGLLVDYRPPVKRSSEHLKGSPQLQRK